MLLFQDTKKVKSFLLLPPLIITRQYQIRFYDERFTRLPFVETENIFTIVGLPFVKTDDILPVPLIKLRTNFFHQFQHNMLHGSLGTQI